MPLEVPDVPIYREGPQSGGPLHVPEWVELRRKTGQRGLLIVSLKKDSDKNIPSGAEAVHVPAHLALPGFPQAKQLPHLHAQLSLGQSYNRQNNSCILRTGSLWSCPTLRDPVDCGLPGFCIREGGFPGKNTGVYWPILVAIPF